MKRNSLYPPTTFIIVFSAHLLYTLWRLNQAASQWVQIEDTSPLSAYISQQEYLMGFSYALAASFTVYALSQYLVNRGKGLSGAVGGVTITRVLYVGVCFLTGCCGSPMLPIYLGLFGPSFLGFTKPLIAVTTTLSVGAGYYWLKRKSNCTCGTSDKCTQTE